MTNIQKISNRLQVLEKRREKLILLNHSHHFSQSGNPRIKTYFKLLNEIRSERYLLEKQKIQECKNTAQHQFLMSTKGLNGTQILILNN